MMNKYKERAVFISLVFFLLPTFVYSLSEFTKYRLGEPIKEFETAERNIFCEKQKLLRQDVNETRDCDRLNHHNLKIFFSLFMAIGFGAAVRTVIRVFHLSIPYTVVLMISGLLLGLGSRINKPFCEVWTPFTKIARTPPEIILYVFLPVLIFESAFSMKAHVFFRSWGQITVLAVPGMVVSTFITAIACRQFMPNYKWTFSESCLFGAIISATDPVAVVAILRESGTSEMLSIMVEGESLLNDGVAILLYEVFKEFVEEPDGDEDQELKLVALFIRITIGGPAFGFLMGKLSCLFLSRIFNDAATEITITVVTAYLTYFIAEHFLGVSGVLSVVILGITMSSESTSISPEVEGLVHQFWEMLSYIANTVLFLIVGVVITETAANSFESFDGVYMIVLYISLNVIRLLMLFLFSPFIGRLGYGINWKTIMVLMWGGLRGAVGMLLALEIYKNKKLCHLPNVGPKILLQTAGIVFFTLVVNGTTTSKLLDTLGITEISLGKLQDMSNAMKVVLDARSRTLAILKHDRFLADASWRIVHSFTIISDPYGNEIHKRDSKNEKKNSHTVGLIERLFKGGHLSKVALAPPAQPPSTTLPNAKESKTVLEKTASTTSRTSTFKPFSRSTVFTTPTPEEFRDMTEEARLRFLKAIKISVWRQFEKGILSEMAVQTLIASVEDVEDQELAMVHVLDMKSHWKVHGITPRLRKILGGLSKEALEDIGPPPATRWRYPAYWLITKPWFDLIIYGIVLLNIIPIAFDTYYYYHDVTLTVQTEIQLVVYSSCFTILYVIEFLLRIIGRGCKEYWKYFWNVLDFTVIVVSILEIILSVVAIVRTQSNRNVVTTFLNTMKNIRLLRFTKAIRWMRPGVPFFVRLVERRIDTKLALGYEIAKGYVTALEDTLRFLHQMVEHPLLQLRMQLIIDYERREGYRELGLLEYDHPHVAAAMKTKHATRIVLNQMKESLLEMKEDGLLDEKEFTALLNLVEDSMKHLYSTTPRVAYNPADTIFDNVPWIGKDVPLRMFLKNYATVENYEIGTEIYKVDDPPDGIHVIVSGIVKITYQPQERFTLSLEKHGKIINKETVIDLSGKRYEEDYLGAPCVLGEIGVVTDYPRAASVECETDVVAYHVGQEAMKNAMKVFNDKFDSLESRIWRSIGLKVIVEYLPTQPAYTSWSVDKIKLHLETSTVPTDPKFLTMSIPLYVSDVFVLNGQLINHYVTREVYTAPCLVPKSCLKLNRKNDCPIPPVIFVVANEEGLEGHHDDSSSSNPHKSQSVESLQEALERSPGGLSNRPTQTEAEIEGEVPQQHRMKSVARRKISLKPNPKN